MIDEVLDSLLLNRPRTMEDLTRELTELCRGVSSGEALEPILHSFQDNHLLRIGVSDLLGKADVRETTQALSDLAETLLHEVIVRQQGPLVSRYGTPILANGPRAGCEPHFAVLAAGKLGGREMSYHSDLDLIFIYEGDGKTTPPRGASRFTQVGNGQYFAELAQRIIRTMSSTGSWGKLYAVDIRIRPAGNAGTLALSLDEFRRYYAPDGPAHLWERQTLTRARVIFGERAFSDEISSTIRQAAFAMPWQPNWVEELKAMREKLEASGSPRSLKRGRGGLNDVEFIVQIIQIRHGHTFPAICQTNVWEALEELARAGLITSNDRTILSTSYSFLRRVEGRMRLMTNRATNELPEDENEMVKLARRLGYDSLHRFEEERHLLAEQTREIFLRTILAER